MLHPHSATSDTTTLWHFWDNFTMIPKSQPHPATKDTQPHPAISATQPHPATNDTQPHPATNEFYIYIYIFFFIGINFGGSTLSHYDFENSDGQLFREDLVALIRAEICRRVGLDPSSRRCSLSWPTGPARTLHRWDRCKSPADSLVVLLLLALASPHLFLRHAAAQVELSLSILLVAAGHSAHLCPPPWASG